MFILTLQTGKWFKFAIISFNSIEESNTLLNEEFSISLFNLTISELSITACRFCYKIGHYFNDCTEKQKSESNRFKHQYNFENMGRFYHKYQSQVYKKIKNMFYRKNQREFTKSFNTKYNNCYSTDIYSQKGTRWLKIFKKHLTIYQQKSLISKLKYIDKTLELTFLNQL